MVLVSGGSDIMADEVQKLRKRKKLEKSAKQRLQLEGAPEIRKDFINAIAVSKKSCIHTAGVIKAAERTMLKEVRDNVRPQYQKRAIKVVAANLITEAKEKPSDLRQEVLRVEAVI